ncbi:MAG: 3-dehydroquinate synthase [Candidatus Eisenbacteria bacterium]
MASRGRTMKARFGGTTVPIVFAPGGLASLGARMRAAGLAPGSCALITDRNVERLYGARTRSALRGAGFVPRAHLVLPAGERSKSLAAAAVLFDRLAAAGLERGRPIVALGGGVIGDLAGFVAATWLRGVPLVHVPTTVLAQLDSSIGGKVGVDLEAGKNLVGAFHQPRLVLVDPRLLETLPARQVRAGLAEAVKVGLTLDQGLVSMLEKSAADLVAGGPRARAPLARVIERAARAKAKVVAADERDDGVRQVLNYGHTVGHALEALGGYRRWLHGEAVALGMQVAAAAAVRRGLLTPVVAERQRALLRALGLPTRLPAGIEASNVLSYMRLDKKNVAGKPRFVLTTGVGVASFGQPLKRSEVLAALKDAGAE